MHVYAVESYHDCTPFEPALSCFQDNDNRVREASHKALRACAEKVKNALGPHLRSLIGCWVAGMCDPHGPAASSAQAAFSAAFPAGKQKDVFKFGFKAILMVSFSLFLVSVI